MSMQQLASRKNLLLAWRRISTGLNVSYKSVFRNIYQAYELDHSNNLEDLRKRIRDGVYSPLPSARIFMPKASGLQRPITHLTIEDQIVLQAIANLFALKIHEKRKGIENKGVFSYLLNSPSNIFMFKPWEENYQNFQGFILEHYKEGNKWVAYFDLAEFYSTFDHEILIKTISPRGGNRDLINLILRCLRDWSSNIGQLNHGIPQGPIASNLLGECFMLDIDHSMINKHIYARYVDDIWVMAKSELELRRALTNLDILCKEYGLIPNTKKLVITRINSIKSLKDLFPTWFDYSEALYRIPLEQFKAEDLFLESLSSDQKHIQDISLFKYTLNRAPKSYRILRKLLSLWKHYPELSEVIFSYLDIYDRNLWIVNYCLKVIKENHPYDYVRGVAWRLLARMASDDEAQQLLDLAIQTVKNKKEDNSTRFGAQAFLISCEAKGLGEYSNWVRWEQNPIIQAQLAPYFDIRTTGSIKAIKRFMRSNSPDPGLGLLSTFSRFHSAPDKIGYDLKQLPITVQNSYFVAGIVEKPNQRQHNPMSMLLKKRYNIPRWNGWQTLFGGDYQDAHSHLVTADTLLESQYTGWLAYTDSFCHELFSSFQTLLNTHNALGKIPLTEKRGTRVRNRNYGAMLYDNRFTSEYPKLAKDLQEIHSRRNKLPTSHPHDLRTGERSTPLKKRERSKFARHFREAVIEIVQICSHHI